MKIIIFFTLLLLLNNRNCFCQKNINALTKADSVIINKLKGERPESYNGRELNDFIQNQVFKTYKSWLPSTEPPGVLHSIILSYSKRVYIQIIFLEIKYQKQFNLQDKWDFNLLKKEKIYQVIESWNEK